MIHQLKKTLLHPPTLFIKRNLGIWLNFQTKIDTAYLNQNPVLAQIEHSTIPTPKYNIILLLYVYVHTFFIRKLKNWPSNHDSLTSIVTMSPYFSANEDASIIQI